MSKNQLVSPDLLKVNTSSGGFYLGGSQHWFHKSWKRMSGCGPTTAAGTIWYLARSRQNNAICETGISDQTGFLKLMDTLFDYITPGMAGVNSTSAFIDGVKQYGNSCGVRLQARSLDIPPVICGRPGIEDVCSFILESLQSDLPLAFLNLSNGSLKNLNSWHWVMVIAIEPDTMTVTICDQGGTKEIDLSEWLKTTLLGGGMVSIYV